VSVFEAVIGWLAPPQCIGCGAEGSAFCHSCSTSEIIAFGERCAYCGSLSPRAQTCVRCRRAGTPSFVWISTNHEAMAQELVRVYKFGHLRAAAGPLAELMSQTYVKFNSQPYRGSAGYCVVPLPTATSRIRQRGFGHAELLAKIIAQNLDMPYCQALGRLGQTRQVGTSRQTRLAQQAENYFVRQPHRVRGRSVLLIDDVMTTGGSLIAATKALREAGASRVDALVFAKRL